MSAGHEPATEISWLVGTPWQGQGFASEATMAVVAWLETRGVDQITAWIRPDHHAAAAVADPVSGISPAFRSVVSVLVRFA